jgi:hypothetical protein
MIWLLIALAFDEFATLAVGVVLALTIGRPLMPHLSHGPVAILHTLGNSLHHPMLTLRAAASHWDRHA